MRCDCHKDLSAFSSDVPQGGEEEEQRRRCQLLNEHKKGAAWGWFWGEGGRRGWRWPGLAVQDQAGDGGVGAVHDQVELVYVLGAQLHVLLTVVSANLGRVYPCRFLLYISSYLQVLFEYSSLKVSLECVSNNLLNLSLTDEWRGLVWGPVEHLYSCMVA